MTRMFNGSVKIAGVLAALAMVPNGAAAAATRPWAAYYADEAPASAFDRFELLVFDSDRHPPLRILQDHGKKVFGYISLGEVNEDRYYFNDVKAEGIFLDRNPNWPESHYVDLRDQRWARRIIEQLIPDLLHRGFDGLLLDTLDDAGHLERLDARKYRGMTEAAARLVRAIRRDFPGVPIMLNRAFEILPMVEDAIDMVLGESIVADYDFDAKTYRLVDPEQSRGQIALLKAAQQRRPKLRVLSLDYWDPADPAGVARIYRQQRANGFEPYVATVELDRVVTEPAQ